MVLGALHQQVASCFLAYRLRQIQLLIQPFRPQTNARFQNLGQPFGTMPRGIDGGTATGYGPAAIQRGSGMNRDRPKIARLRLDVSYGSATAAGAAARWLAVSVVRRNVES